MLNSGKVSDHHAIIPTVQIENADTAELPNGELNLLKLIICRLISAAAEPYVYENTTAIFECGGHTFTAKGKRVVSYGFKAVEKLLASSSENEDGETSVIFTEGQTFSDVTAEMQEKYTAPPKPYTEDTLLSAMEAAGAKETTDDAERKGLGTPATRAAILEKLVQTGFAERKGKNIMPTKNGTLLVSVLPDTLISASLTAEWENRLSMISKGKASPKKFMQGIEAMLVELVSRYREFDKTRSNPFQEKSGVELCVRRQQRQRVRKY